MLGELGDDDDELPDGDGEIIAPDGDILAGAGVVAGDVDGDVVGEVDGDVAGEVAGDVAGEIVGDEVGVWLTGDVAGDTDGEVAGEVAGVEGGGGLMAKTTVINFCDPFWQSFLFPLIKKNGPEWSNLKIEFPSSIFIIGLFVLHLS